MAAPAPAPTPAPAPPAPVPAAATYTSEAARLAAEKEQKDKTLQEKLDKRAVIVAGVLRKFVVNFYTGRQQMLDAARAAEALKAASKGKKKGAADKEDNKGDKGGKPKKPPPTPVQQAWITFLADMDDRINKQKRIFLEDMYRGVAQLDARDQQLLGAAIATTTNKILPLDGMNINQLNIKEAVTAGCAAGCAARASALPVTGNPGLSGLKDRGASVNQLLEFGYKEHDALRVGYPCHAVVHASQHDLHSLREAGVTPAELLTCPEAPQLAADLTQGLRGITLLKEAGFSACDLVSGGLDNPWALTRAGYNAQDLRQAGVSPAPLPVQLMSGTMQPCLGTNATHLPQKLTGTQDPAWQAVLAASSQAAPGAADGGVRASSVTTASNRRSVDPGLIARAPVRSTQHLAVPSQ